MLLVVTVDRRAAWVSIGPTTVEITQEKKRMDVGQLLVSRETTEVELAQQNPVNVTGML